MSWVLSFFRTGGVYKGKGRFMLHSVSDHRRVHFKIFFLCYTSYMTTMPRKKTGLKRTGETDVVFNLNGIKYHFTLI